MPICRHFATGETMKLQTYLLTSLLLLSVIAFAPGASAGPNQCDKTVETNCVTNYECRAYYQGQCYAYTADHCLAWAVAVCVYDLRYYLESA